MISCVSFCATSKSHTQPTTGTHLRLFLRTMKTSLCVCMKYVRHQAYHQSAYICIEHISNIHHADNQNAPTWWLAIKIDFVGNFNAITLPSVFRTTISLICSSEKPPCPSLSKVMDSRVDANHWVMRTSRVLSYCHHEKTCDSLKRVAVHPLVYRTPSSYRYRDQEEGSRSRGSKNRT
jgi:hypothetical protein